MSISNYLDKEGNFFVPGTHLYHITSTPTDPNEAASKAYVDSVAGGGSGEVTNPMTANLDANSYDITNIVNTYTTSLYVDDLREKTTDHDIVVHDTINMTNNKIKNLDTPTHTKDATNKTYVDSQISNLNEEVVSNTSDIATNTSAIATNVTNIATNTANIATNTSAIATNQTNIATNTSAIATNTSNIATNTSAIATNASNITNNTNNIATNTSAIATNTSNIATNTSAIATNTSAIATNASNITNNTNNIATNTANIATNTANIATNTANIATKATINDLATNDTETWSSEKISNEIAGGGGGGPEFSYFSFTKNTNNQTAGFFSDSFIIMGWDGNDEIMIRQPTARPNVYATGLVNYGGSYQSSQSMILSTVSNDFYLSSGTGQVEFTISSNTDNTHPFYKIRFLVSTSTGTHYCYCTIEKYT
jgi:hypothetical protein